MCRARSRHASRSHVADVVGFTPLAQHLPATPEARNPPVSLVGTRAGGGSPARLSTASRRLGIVRFRVTALVATLGMTLNDRPERDAPAGWSYNPSAWPQRLPIVGLALVGAAIATYLTLYQLEVVTTVWEPFFGRGSERVLNSSVSRLLPVPDAALGAAGYLADAITGVIGGTERWRTMPWLVVLFGLAVGPLGAASIVLVVLQPVLFDSFCTLCLASAVTSVVMIGPAMDEVLASLQVLRRARDERQSVWRVFWKGSST